METLPREYREIALAWWRQKKLIDTQDDGIQDMNRLGREVDRLGRCVEMLGVTVRDYTGRPYGNLNVEAVAIEPDASVENETIFETISPEIVYKGEVIQRSRVVVHKPDPKLAVKNESEQHGGKSIDRSSCDVTKEEETVSEQEDFATSNIERDPQTLWGKCIPSLLIAFAGISVVLCAACLIILFCIRPIMLERFDRIDMAIQHVDDDLVALEESSTAGANDNERVYDTELVLIEYEVMSGDTLLEICKSQGIDYESHVQLICRLNGLVSPDSIVAGETLVLPVASEE